MFDFLKKKISGLVDRITGKAEGEATEVAPKPQKIGKEEAVSETKIELKPESPETKPELKQKAAEPKREEKTERIDAKPKPAAEKTKKSEPADVAPAHIEKQVKREPAQKPVQIETRAGKVGPKPRPIAPPLPEQVEKAPEEKPLAEPAAETRKPDKMPAKEAWARKGGEKDTVKLSILTQIKSVLSSEVELGEQDVGSAFDDFEMELLETDVAFDVAEQIKQELRKELVGKRISKGNVQKQISGIFYNSIKAIMAENTGKPLPEQIRELLDAGKGPVKIMFTGPNGSGKTTTIAKVANMLKAQGYCVVIAAADTFRAAAIEQMEIHGNMLGVKVIKGKYGADPTSVAFDAVNHAKAHGADVVLIDTAGRQETNQNLLNELKKMVRVIAPEIRIYVGESIAGNSVIEQVDAFNKELGLTGVILTKLDCDAKGGTVISISKVTKVPVLYITTGQGYADIEVFEPDRIAERIAG